MSTPPSHVSVRDAHGDVLTIAYTEVSSAAGETPGLYTSTLALDDGSQLIQRTGAMSAEGFASLDREIRSLVRLQWAFDDASYPPELPYVVGYNVDCPEPFSLVKPYRGIPAVDIAGRLTSSQRQNFTISMLRALNRLAQADIVHSRLRLECMRWDGNAVQIVDLSEARLCGEPCRHASGSPSGGAGARLILPDHRDDIRAAGEVLYHVATGEEYDPTKHAGHLAALGSDLGALLTSMLIDDTSRRPTASSLLQRLRSTGASDRTVDVNSVYAEGKLQYDLLHDRRPRRSDPRPVIIDDAFDLDDEDESSAPSRRTGAFLVLLGIVAIMIIVGMITGWTLFK